MGCLLAYLLVGPTDVLVLMFVRLLSLFGRYRPARG